MIHVSYGDSIGTMGENLGTFKNVYMVEKETRPSLEQDLSGNLFKVWRNLKASHKVSKSNLDTKANTWWYFTLHCWISDAAVFN